MITQHVTQITSCLFLPQERGKKIHFKHEFLYIKFIFFHLNFILPKLTFFAVLVTQIPVCFDKKIYL